MHNREIERVVTTAPPSPGFMGEGHTAVPVVEPNQFARTDPFILLMDDRIDLEPGQPAGAAHPHGGFETVTFVVEGELRDRDEGTLKTGDVLWMTAEYIARDSAAVRTEPRVEARVYSGNSGGARATTHNFVPVTLVDLGLQPGARFEQELPDSYNGFIYVLDGDVSVGQRNTPVAVGQVGWLTGPEAGSGENRSLAIIAGGKGARLILYAGERQGIPIVQHGPFVGQSRNDIVRLSQLYMSGKMPRISELTPSASVR